MGPRVVCLVLPWLDEVDAEQCFEPQVAPALQREPLSQFQERLAGIDRANLRDPNSNGRLRYLAEWLTQQGLPEVVGWQLEPTETAGDGESWSR